MLTLDTLRGMDGTGAYAVLGNRQVSTCKIASHPFHLFATDEWNKFQSKVVSQGRIVIGHNRKATQGSINSENAHPFVEENIILVHNGTLRGNHKELGDREVDSHAVCHAFATRGAEEVLPEIDGAFAFVWWDTKQDRLFVIRNDERPLTIVTCDEYYAVASESWMAQAMISRDSKKVTKIEEFKPGVLYSFDLKGNVMEKPIKLREKWVANTNMNTGYRPSPASNCGMHGDCGDDELIDGWEQKKGVWMKRSPSPNLKLIAPTTKPDPKVEELPFTPVSRASSSSVVTGPSAGDVLKALPWVKGMIVNVQISSSRQENINSRVQLFGKILMAGMPETDCTGFLPKRVDIVESGDYQGMGKMVIGRVLSSTMSTCGVSVWLDNLTFDREVKLHHTDLPLGQTQWDYIIDNCKCGDCRAVIYDEEAEFTSVTRMKGNHFKILCADCIQDKLPAGEFKDDFSKRRDIALQGGFAKREAHIASSGDTPPVQNTQTIH